MKHRHSSAGMTLIEVMLFLALVGICSISMYQMLADIGEKRVRQETAFSVEQNGMQLLQLLSYNIRRGERISLPAAGVSGAVLAMQSDSGALDPTIIGRYGTALYLINRNSWYRISSSEISVNAFSVRNTSVSASRPSVTVFFRLSKPVPYSQTTVSDYTRTYQQTIALNPDDTTAGNACSCSAPVCASSNLQWSYCVSGICNSPALSFALNC